MREPKLLRATWNQAKAGASINIGPVALNIRLSRAVVVSSNQARRLREWARHLVAKRDSPEPLTQFIARPGNALESEHRPAVAGTAVVVGVGDGLGVSLANRFVCGGMNLALASRNATRLDPLVEKLRSPGRKIFAYGCDATNERSVKSAMGFIEKDLETPDLVVYSVQGSIPGGFLDMEAQAFLDAWRANCLGAFIVGRESARLMIRQRRGTIIFVGGTSSKIGRGGYLNLAVGEFGLRALAQVMARELSPRGIHVVHLVVDSDIAAHGSPQGDEVQMRSEDLADLVFALHSQPRSVWTHELDVRPWNERFWEHC